MQRARPQGGERRSRSLRASPALLALAGARAPHASWQARPFAGQQRCAPPSLASGERRPTRATAAIGGQCGETECADGPQWQGRADSAGQRQGRMRRQRKVHTHQPSLLVRPSGRRTRPAPEAMWRPRHQRPAPLPKQLRLFEVHRAAAPLALSSPPPPSPPTRVDAARQQVRRAPPPAGPRAAAGTTQRRQAAL